MANKQNQSEASQVGDDNTGLSTRVESRNQRAIRDDGTFNIENHGMPFMQPADIYQTLIRMPWWKFIIIVFCFYLLVNTIFAFIYYFLGTENLTNVVTTTPVRSFLEDFFFSAQSLTTVGYGRVAPIGMWTSAVAAIESMVGLLGFALATGLLYGRFSRPSAKIIRSQNMLIAPYRDGIALMFRIANGRRSQLIEVEVSVQVSKINVEMGKEIRRFYPIELERERIAMFPMAWTIVHPINENSPLFGKTQHDLEREDIEVLMSLKAFDDTFSDTVHSRLSYKYTDLIWGAKFVINYEQRADGSTLHHLDKVGEYYRVELPSAPLLTLNERNN